MNNNLGYPQVAAGESRKELENSFDQRPSEVVIIISSDEKIQSCASETAAIRIKSGEGIDYLESGENSDLKRDWVCRICLSNSDSVSSTLRALSTKDDLIQLGCKCKGEIGFMHVRCAQDWFRTKGNSCCEVCGDTVKNIDECRIVLGDQTEGTNVGRQATETTRSEARNTANTSSNMPVNATYSETCGFGGFELFIWFIVVGALLVLYSTNKPSHD